jgi:hypothetical protein
MIITIKLWLIMDFIAKYAFSTAFEKVEVIKWLRTNDVVIFGGVEYADKNLGLLEAKAIVELLLLNIGSPYFSGAVFQNTLFDGLHSNRKKICQ